MLQLRAADGVLVPGGFGNRGVEGKILAAQYARENKVPYLGICLGMQVGPSQSAGRAFVTAPHCSLLSAGAVTSFFADFIASTLGGLHATKVLQR